MVSYGANSGPSVVDNSNASQSATGNTAFCEPTPYQEESPASTIVSLVEEAKLPSVDVKSPSNALLSFCKSFIAGGVAGGVSRSAVAPLERLKILLQVQNSQNPQYKGMLQGLRHIFKTEGAAGFFIGNGVNCARIIPNSAVKFLSYEHASNAILWLYRRESGNSEAELNPVLRLAAGACAGIVAMSATYPMDMVRGRLTVQTKGQANSYNGMFHAMKMISKQEGPLAMYKGWLPSVIGVVPYVGLNFAVYETLKDWATKKQEGSELTVMTKLGCGAVAGTVGQTVAYPLDVIRRRMQMGGWKAVVTDATSSANAAPPKVIHYNGMVDAFKQTVRNEGWGALYKGLIPNSAKVVPSIALAFVTYEFMRELLGVDMRIPD